MGGISVRSLLKRLCNTPDVRNLARNVSARIFKCSRVLIWLSSYDSAFFLPRHSLRCHGVSYLVLVWLASSCLVAYHLASSCIVVFVRNESCPIFSPLIVSYIVLSCLIFSAVVMSCVVSASVVASCLSLPRDFIFVVAPRT